MRSHQRGINTGATSSKETVSFFIFLFSFLFPLLKTTPQFTASTIVPPTDAQTPDTRERNTRRNYPIPSINRKPFRFTPLLHIREHQTMLRACAASFDEYEKSKKKDKRKERERRRERRRRIVGKNSGNNTQ